MSHSPQDSAHDTVLSAQNVPAADLGSPAQGQEQSESSAASPFPCHPPPARLQPTGMQDPVCAFLALCVLSTALTAAVSCLTPRACLRVPSPDLCPCFQDNLVFVVGKLDGLMVVGIRRHNADDIVATALAVEPMKFVYRGR